MIMTPCHVMYFYTEADQSILQTSLGQRRMQEIRLERYTSHGMEMARVSLLIIVQFNRVSDFINYI